MKCIGLLLESNEEIIDLHSTSYANKSLAQLLNYKSN